MNRPSDIEGEFYLFETKRSSKANPVCSGYIPLHKLYDNYLSSGKHEYLDRQWVAPGETAKVRVWFITPEAYPGCLWIGRKLDVMEGTQLVGTITVTSIFNEGLLVNAGS